ncbi:MAG: sigma-70 family RNA polymerase sigma factor, partial [Lachnospiraceae bacterium]|nr:sigma-70 family RNA polymerase sigma factor [Lachnospiraceae bacterium]
DLIQEGMIGLFKAVRDYDCGRDAAFSTFAELCINRQIYKALQASNRKKNIPLNSYISLYGEKESEEGAFNPLENIVDNSKPGPEELVLDRERVDYLEQVIEKELSSFENEVLELMLTGLNYVEIARILGKTDKSVDNCIQRIKGKIRKIL